MAPRKEGETRNVWLVWLIAAGVVVAGLILWAAFVQPPWLLDTSGLKGADLAKARNDFRGTMLTALGGLAVIVGAIVGALNLAHNREVLEEAQRQNRATAAQNEATFEETQRQNRAVLEIQRRGQVTERFAQAVELLGQADPDNLDVRVGGVYALEQIARDSPDELHWPVMEVLTAHLRHFRRAQLAPSTAQGTGETPEDATAPVDAQAIANVIGRRGHEHDPPKQRLDLHEADLSHIRWPNEAHLERAILVGAHLVKAYLVKAHLEEALLQRAHLNGAHLSKGHLEKAYLTEAHLEGAELDAAHLEEAYLVRAHLKGAKLIGARLKKAQLNAAHLERADLSAAWLEEADLQDVDLAQVIGLTWAQVKTAKNVDVRRLPAYIRREADRAANAEPAGSGGSGS